METTARRRPGGSGPAAPTPRLLHDARCIGHPEPASLSYAEARALVAAHAAAHPEWVRTATPGMLEVLAEIGRPMQPGTPYDVAKSAIDAHRRADPDGTRHLERAAARRASGREDSAPAGRLAEYLRATREKNDGDPQRAPASREDIRRAMDLAFARPEGDALRIKVFSALKKGASAGWLAVLIKQLQGTFVERRPAQA